jgi:nucleotide-binding universal stress UspA family protein
VDEAMFDKILVPLDGSQLAEQALPTVVILARAFAAEVHLLGVCEPDEGDGPDGCHAYIQGVAGRLREEVGTGADKIRAVTLEGEAAPAITAYARQEQVGVVVLTTHGRSGLKPWPLGGTVNRLAHAPMASIVVQAGEPPTAASDIFDRILAPLDGSEGGARAIPFLHQIAERMPVRITLLRVVEKEHDVRTIGGLDSVRFREEDLKARTRIAEQYLAEIAARFAGTQASVGTVVRFGKPADEILKLAAEIGAPLIAVPSHLESPIVTWFHGSVTQKVIQTPGNSFFLVPTEEAVY